MSFPNTKTLEKLIKMSEKRRATLGPYPQSREIKSIWGTLEEESYVENRVVSQKSREEGSNLKVLGLEYSTLRKKNSIDFV